MKCLSPLCLLALGLSACADGPTRGLLASVDRTPVGATREIPPPAPGADARSGAAAILELPVEARVRGRMEERRYANGWRQSVALDRKVMGKGWNELTVDLRTAPAAAREGEISMGKPTEEGVRKELSMRFPATRMRILTEPMRNALGPFGLAVGPGPQGTRCAFAWQWVDDLRAAARTDAAETRIARGDEIPASIRLRVCRKGATDRQFVDWYSRLRATEPAHVDRVVEAARSGADAPAPAVETRPATSPRLARAARKPRPAARRREAGTTVVERHREAPRFVAPPASRLDPSLPSQAYSGPPAAR
jgi:hypothetical protein